MVVAAATYATARTAFLFTRQNYISIIPFNQAVRVVIYSVGEAYVKHVLQIVVITE